MLIQFLPKNHAMHLMILKYLMKNETRLIWNKKDLVHCFFGVIHPLKSRIIRTTFWSPIIFFRHQVIYIWDICGVLQLKPDEIKGIIADFDEPGHLAPTGLFIAAQKYMVIQESQVPLFEERRYVRTHIYITNIHETCIYSVRYPKCLHMKVPFLIKEYMV